MDPNSETSNHEAELAETLGNALASEAQVATAPESQVNVADSITAPETVQTPGPSWYEQLGLQGTDEAAALQQVRQNFNSGQQYFQQAQHFARKNQELQQKLHALEAARQVAAPQQTTVKSEAVPLPWEPVELDPEWLNHIDPNTRDWKPTAPLSAIEGYARYKKAKQAFDNAMLKNPEAVLRPFIESHAKQLITPLQEKLEAFEARQSQQAQQNEIQGLLSPYLPQLYVTDANGTVQRDQFGNPVQTAMGQSFNQYAQTIQQSGVTDPKQVALMALMASQINSLQSQLAQRPAQPATREQHDAALLANSKKPANGATHQPNRGNTIKAAQAPEAPLQNQRFSMEDVLMSGLKDSFPHGIPTN